MARIDKENYYLDIADTVLKRSTCLRRCYGAIIVKNDEILSTGYNGAPRGRKNCTDLGRCTREELQVPSGQRYELCRSVHAEANAIISAARSEALGATLYMACVEPDTGAPCREAVKPGACWAVASIYVTRSRIIRCFGSWKSKGALSRNIRPESRRVRRISRSATGLSVGLRMRFW